LLLRDGLEDPLDDTGLVQQQLDQLSTIGRCEYEKTCALLVQLFDQSAQSYQELLQSATASPMDVAVQEGERVWRSADCGLAVGCLFSKVPFLKPAFLVKSVNGEADLTNVPLERCLYGVEYFWLWPDTPNTHSSAG